MPHIVAEIISLIQYLKILEEEPRRNRLERCVCCGRLGLWLHGGYPRKADRSGVVDESLNPILIQRFFCPGCRRTCSALPECIPPHRWHLWEVQQIALLLLLAGKSVYAVAKEMAPSRHTIARWAARFKEQFHLHKDVLCHHFVELGRVAGFTDFWQLCFKQIPLSSAMRLCHVSGVAIP